MSSYFFARERGCPRQTRRSRERILDAAARQISEHGLDSVSVADSMQSAALIKGVFYAYFASREAMIAEAADRVTQHGQARIDHPFFVNKKRRLRRLRMSGSTRSTSRISVTDTGSVR